MNCSASGTKGLSQSGVRQEFAEISSSPLYLSVWPLVELLALTKFFEEHVKWWGHVHSVSTTFADLCCSNTIQSFRI